MAVIPETTPIEYTPFENNEEPITNVEKMIPAVVAFVLSWILMEVNK